MGMQAGEIMALIRKTFPDAEIDIRDLAGDGNHFSVTVTSQLFAGKTPVQQHQMVYVALEGHVGTTLHALSVVTRVPQKD